MITKTVLVIFLLTSRNEVTIQYIARFQTEAQCQAEAEKHMSKESGWSAYPVKKAQCVMDITKDAQ